MYKGNFEVKFHYGAECFTKIIEDIVQTKIHEYHIQGSNALNDVKSAAPLIELKKDGEEHDESMEGSHICKSFNR